MIELSWEWLVVIITVSASLGGAINHFREIFAALKKPREEMRGSITAVDAKLNAHMTKQAEDQAANERRFKNDLTRVEKLEIESKLSLRGILTLITAGIDGNHKAELEERRDEIQKYLIDKA